MRLAGESHTVARLGLRFPRFPGSPNPLLLMAYGNRHADDRRPAGHGREGQNRPSSRHRERRQDPLLLLSSRARDRRLLPRLHREDREDAEAADLLFDAGRRGHGRLDADPGRRRGPCERVRVPADQPPARLPGLRQRRRVSLTGFLVLVRPEREPDGVRSTRVRRRGCARRRRFRSDADAQPESLHPLHALRQVHARSGCRRANQHRRPGLRQRDRHVPRARRPFAALGQPDGCVPGRCDHDTRLPLQIAAVGQPGGGRHDLHALREGLQHDGLDQSQARMGEGRATRPDDAAAQPRGEQLLDVRHRPLRLPLDRRRRSAATAAAAERRRHARTDRLAEPC